MIPLLVRLHNQDRWNMEDCQPAWFVIDVNEQTGETLTTVTFITSERKKFFYKLADPAMCFPPVPPVDDPNPPNPPNHPTFHEWITSTFSGQPGFVLSDHFTPRDFVDYMRYMSYYYVI